MHSAYCWEHSFCNITVLLRLFAVNLSTLTPPLSPLIDSSKGYCQQKQQIPRRLQLYSQVISAQVKADRRGTRRRHAPRAFCNFCVLRIDSPPEKGTIFSSRHGGHQKLTTHWLGHLGFAQTFYGWPWLAENVLVGTSLLKRWNALLTLSCKNLQKLKHRQARKAKS